MFNIIDYTEYMFHINLLGSLVPTEKKASSYPILLKFHNSSVFKLGVKTFHLILILEYSHLHLVHSQPTCFSNFNFRQLDNTFKFRDILLPYFTEEEHRENEPFCVSYLVDSRAGIRNWV